MWNTSFKSTTLRDVEVPVVRVECKDHTLPFQGVDRARE